MLISKTNENKILRRVFFNGFFFSEGGTNSAAPSESSVTSTARHLLQQWLPLFYWKLFALEELVSVLGF